jgi:hypothetical protein
MDSNVNDIEMATANMAIESHDVSKLFPLSLVVVTNFSLPISGIWDLF